MLLRNLYRMKKEEKLYETLGELLYAVAIADGIIQVEEKNALQYFFRNHNYQDAIKWSFEYEEEKNTSLEESYQKAIAYCHAYGPSPVYPDFIEAMKIIAKAADGIHEKETEIINSFSNDLSERFKRDADAVIYYNRPDRD